ncbi:hypothetical protein BASA62_004914 [Batrachochytrium salamandrivorans]|nr:hypothetical protein BASA62_004914 [Batrachochytrium salamandrivorans]
MTFHKQPLEADSNMTESSSIDLLGKSALVEKTVLGTFYDQLAIMLHKNTLLQYRYLGSTIAQALLAPLVFSLIMFLLQQADYASQVMPEASLHMPANQLQGVQRCQGVEPGKPCVTIMYAIEPAPLNDSAPIRPLAEALVPSDVNYTKILETFSILNQKRVGYRLNFEQPFTNYSTPATQIYDIVQVPSSQFIYNHTLQQSNVTAWAITFTQPVAATPINVQYQVWYNDKNVASGSDLYGRDLVSFVRGMDEAIISVLNDPTATITADLDISIQDWAELPSSDIISRVYQKLGPAFFFCSEMIVFINVMSQIVTEKELKLRHGMEVMGLMPGVYWLSHFISTSALVIVNGLSMVAWGFAFGFPTITHTNIAITIITFILFGEAMVLMAFFMTTFLKRTNNAILMAIFIFIIGLLLQAFVFSDPQTSYVLWTHGYLEIGYVYVMYFLPFFNFGHIFVDISTVTFGRVDAQTGTKSQGGSFQWSNMFSPLPQNLVPAYNQAEGVNVPLPIQACGFSTGDQVMEVEDDEDDDVKAARERALDPEQYPAVKIVNLRKVYGKTGLFDTGEKEKVAVRSSCFTVDEGKLFALLGQNGAGKSTTISILAGLTPATSGDALMYNLSVRHQSQRIRRSMGICPQHDILFDDLTAREHIELYAGIKGVARSTIKNLVEERLKVVRLHTVADVRAGTYSGGMKRRLSLVISTIGDPRVIFMDEPTTGMDPVNRRCVWSFIEKFKQGRVIMLTTHSMEEADVLGDEVGIMSNGRIRAVNNAIALKTKFGAGYHVSIVTDVADSEKVEAIVHDIVPDAVLSDKSGGALLYQFPASSKTAVPKLVGWLETNAEGLVKSWGIGQTTLEEVFLKLVRESNTLFSVRDEEEAKMRLKVYKKRK